MIIIDDLVMAAGAFPELEEKYLMFISKSGFTEPVKRRAMEEGASLAGLDDLYRGLLNHRLAISQTDKSVESGELE